MSKPEQERISQDLVFDLLSNPRRRFVISFLRQEEDPVNLIDLAREVAAWENDTTVDRLTEQQEKRVYVSIYQTHVPKLHEAGVIDYDRESGMVSITDSVTELDRYLPKEEKPELPWPRYYAAVAVVGAVFYLLAFFQVSVFGLVPTTIAGIVVVLAFIVTAAAHQLYLRTAREQLAIDLVER